MSSTCPMRSAFVLALALSFLIPESGSTQEEAADPPPAQARAVGIESITVTAEKREADLQDIGLSIQVFTGEDLERLAIDDPGDLSGMVPGMTFVRHSAGPNMLSFSGRGLIHGDVDPMTVGTVGMYVDGVYLQNASSALFELIDVERIEFLKGPQGTLFGRNTIGGAVQITSVKPTTEFEGRIKVRAGEYNRRDIIGTLNLPLVGESLLSRLSFSRTRRDGFWQNDHPGNREELSDDNDSAARAALRWIPNERVTVDYSFDWFQSRQHQDLVLLNHVYDVIPCDLNGNGLSGFADGFPDFCDELGRWNFGWAIPPIQEVNWRDPDGAFINHDGNTDSSQSIWNHAFAIQWDVRDDMALKLFGGWRRSKNKNSNDQDASGRSLGHFTNVIFDRSFNTELQLLGSLLEDRLTYVVGAMWYQEQFSSRLHSNLYEDAAFPLFSSTRNVGDNQALGYFAHLDYRLTDRLELTVGARYSTEEKKVTRNHCADVAPFDGHIEVEQCPAAFDGIRNFHGLKRSESWSAWSPMLRLKLNWTDEFMTYIKWSKGFAAGGFGPRASDGSESATAPFDPEFLYSWEMGFKSRWLDNRLQINASGFYDDHEDQQVTIFIPGAGTNTIVDNAGKSRIRGFEAELQLAPIEGLRFALTHAWTHATFSEWIDVDSATGLPVNIADTREFAHVPKRKWTGQVQYMFPPTQLGQLELTGSFVRESEMGSFLQKLSNTYIRLNKRTIFNGRIALHNALGQEGLMLALVGKNVGNRVHREGLGVDFSPLGFAMTRMGPPEQFFFEMQYEF